MEESNFIARTHYQNIEKNREDVDIFLLKQTSQMSF